MPTGRRSSPDTPTIHSGVSGVEQVARTSPRVAAELEDLCLDSLETMRAMLEHGSTDERIQVFKALAPVISKMGQESAGEDGPDPAAKARELLLGNWKSIDGQAS